MRKITKYHLAVFLLIALCELAACERILSDNEKDAVLAFSEASVDNLLGGLSTRNYSVFARDFDTDMQMKLSATRFAALKQDMDGKLGNYISRRVDRVTQADEFLVVTYWVRFEQQEPVKMTVAFHASDHSIAMLGLDSEKMSWSVFQ